MNRRAATRRAVERKKLESAGGGIRHAELRAGRQLKCVHGHLRVLCPFCAKALP